VGTAHQIIKRWPISTTKSVAQPTKIPTENTQMPEYRRAYVPGGTFFFTLVTYQRNPLFSDPENIFRLRHAVATVRSEMPFGVTGAVVLPDHIHFLWTLPVGDQAYSKRVGRLKVIFTQSLQGNIMSGKSLIIPRTSHPYPSPHAGRGRGGVGCFYYK